MINITQGGLCTGSSMSNYVPTASRLRANTVPKAAGGEHTARSHAWFMWAWGDVIVTQISRRWGRNRLSSGSGQAFSKVHPSGIWFLASLKHFGISFFILFQGYTSSTKHMMIPRDLTDDNYSVSARLRADADSSPSPLLQEFQGLCVLPRLPVRHISQARHPRGC